MKTHVFAQMAAVLLAAATASADQVSDTVTSVTSSPAYASAIFAVCVMDPATSEVLHQHDATRSVAPASCLKALTTAAATHFLGPDHRWKTTVEATGPMDGGVLKGDLLIRGGGDPSLASDRVRSAITSATLLRQFVDAVRGAGIQAVEGNIIGDASYFGGESIPEDWTWSDIGQYYGAGVSGLCFYDNMYHLTFQPGSKVGDVAEIIGTTPQMPEIEWTNFMKTGAADSGDQGYVYGLPGTLKRRARGTIPLGPPFSIKGAMPDAPQAAARFLREELTSAGISVSGNPISSNAPASRGRVLATIVSPPMRDVMRVLNKQSFNLYAEMFLMHLGKKAGAESRTDAIKVEEQWLKEMGVDLTGVYILDGSGLSRGNLVTARAMAQMMCGLRDRPNFQVWRDTLPVLGVDGKSGKDLPIRGRVQAKTGYIERVRGLTGYLQAKSGRELTFALFANAYANKMSDVDKDFEAILMAVYEKY